MTSRDRRDAERGAQPHFAPEHRQVLDLTALPIEAWLASISAERSKIESANYSISQATSADCDGVLWLAYIGEAEFPYFVRHGLL